MTTRWVLSTILLLGCLALRTQAAEVPCVPLTQRVQLLRSILDRPWLTIRPDLVRQVWYRELSEVPTACHSEFGCLFLGNATVLPGSGKEPSAGDCSESFIFNPESKSGRPLLTGADLDDWFGTAEEARRAAEALAAVIKPPEGACSFLLAPWSPADRSRECSWAADGDRVIAVSTRLVHRGRAWGATVSISRQEF
jgi:hypothetical protein